MSDVEIHQVRNDADRDAAKALTWEFFEDQKAGYPDLVPNIERYIEDHRIAENLDRFGEMFEPPHGHTFLAWLGAAPVGLVKLRPYRETGGELNRMYVRPEGRGRGAGRKLVSALIATARECGHAYIHLASLRAMTTAQRVYAAHGFRYYNPPDGYRADDNDIVHMRLDLS